MAQVSTVPAPASDAEAVEMFLTALRHMAAADPTAMAAQAQAECLLALEQGDVISAAARARILVAAARAGARQDDLAALAAEIYARSLQDQEDGDSQLSFEDRRVRVETTFAGAGVLSGDLTPECAAVVTAVLDALSAPMGAEDTRSREQRYHDVC